MEAHIGGTELSGTDMKISQPMPIFPRDSSHIALGHPQQ